MPTFGRSTRLGVLVAAAAQEAAKGVDVVIVVVDDGGYLQIDEDIAITGANAVKSESPLP